MTEGEKKIIEKMGEVSPYMKYLMSCKKFADSESIEEREQKISDTWDSCRGDGMPPMGRC